MELHHGLRADHDDPIPRVDLGYSTDAITGEVDLTGRRTAQAAMTRAEELLTQYPDGILDTDLMMLLKDNMGILGRIAVGAVDSLASSGKVIVDDETNIMTLPRV